MELCETQIIILLNLILIAIGLTALLVQYLKNKRDKRVQAPILTAYALRGDLGGFNFVLKNDGPTRVKEIDEPSYDKELLGEFEISGEYITHLAKGGFVFSRIKPILAPQEQCMIIFRKLSNTKPINYEGVFKVIISYKGDFSKPKPLELIFEADTNNRTINPVNFK